MSRRAVFSSLSVAAAALALAACGSSSNTSTSAAASTGPGSASTYQARLNFAKCMRSHGVNVPDPSANGGPAAGAGGGGGGGGFAQLRNDPNFRSASQACAKYRSKAFGFANITPAERAQFQQEQVKFAECMRSHGVNIPDPSSSGTGGGGFGAIFRDITPAERQSPAFQTAFKDCSTTLPFRRRGAGPGGGAPAGGPPA
jgi:hypothetical protein